MKIVLRFTPESGLHRAAWEIVYEKFIKEI